MPGWTITWTSYLKGYNKGEEDRFPLGRSGLDRQSGDKGIDYLKLPTWEEVAKQKYGIGGGLQQGGQTQGDHVPAHFAGDRCGQG